MACVKCEGYVDKVVDRSLKKVGAKMGGERRWQEVVWIELNAAFTMLLAHCTDMEDVDQPCPNQGALG